MERDQMRTARFRARPEAQDDEAGRLPEWIAYPIVGLICLGLWVVIYAVGAALGA